jgi:hypothetical protein
LPYDPFGASTSGVQFWAHPATSRNKLVNFLAKMKNFPEKDICGGFRVKPGVKPGEGRLDLHVPKWKAAPKKETIQFQNFWVARTTL